MHEGLKAWGTRWPVDGEGVGSHQRWVMTLRYLMYPYVLFIFLEPRSSSFLGFGFLTDSVGNRSFDREHKSLNEASIERRSPRPELNICQPRETSPHWLQTQIALCILNSWDCSDFSCVRFPTIRKLRGLWRERAKEPLVTRFGAKRCILRMQQPILALDSCTCMIGMLPPREYSVRSMSSERKRTGSLMLTFPLAINFTSFCRRCTERAPG